MPIAADAMILFADTDKEEYVVGNPVKITASIEDSFLNSPIAPEYIYGVTMQVTAENPAGSQSTFALYDDGLHGDGNANDGVYANSFGSTSQEGDYKFDLRISGNTNRDGQPFTREKSLFVRAINPPLVVSSIRASANPTNYYNVDYTVTFSKSVTGVDVSDLALVANGISGTSVKAVSGTGSVYTVTINTGSGNGTIRLDVVDDDTVADANGNNLGGTGNDNGKFTAGEVYDIDKTVRSTTVTKLTDTNDGFCNADCSLREAIATAIPGDIIVFNAALSGQAIHIASTLSLSKNLTIDGSGLAIPITVIRLRWGCPQ